MAGYKECWSKAVALTLLSIATQQNRACKLIHFGLVLPGNNWIFDFTPSDAALPDVIQALLPFMNARGTDWCPALNKALEAISTQSYKQADIVLITDGICRVDDNWLSGYNKQLEEKGVNTYGVLIGRDSDCELKKVSSTTVQISDLKNDGAIANVFGV
jgi:uncharacterized protein with von Willebrand factor type A (vWA) domain